MRSNKSASRRRPAGALEPDLTAPLVELCRGVNLPPARIVALLLDGRIQALEDENRRLKALVADLSVEAWTRHCIS